MNFVLVCLVKLTHNNLNRFIKLNIESMVKGTCVKNVYRWQNEKYTFRFTET